LFFEIFNFNIYISISKAKDAYLGIEYNIDPYCTYETRYINLIYWLIFMFFSLSLSLSLYLFFSLTA